ncbi:MAG: hypothetical protein NT178_15660 [Proteobacteria bacterium]|nr:hypothetical protein [Pseudomonadota bacterium]
MKSDTDNQTMLPIFLQKSDEDKLSLAKDIIESAKDNEEFLEKIVAECFFYLYVSKGIDPKTSRSGYGGYKNKIEEWMETRFEGKPALTPSCVVSECRKNFKIPAAKSYFLKSLARKVKNRVRMREKRGGLVFEKTCKDHPDIKIVQPIRKPIERTARYADPDRFKLSRDRIEPSHVDKMIAVSASLYPESVEYWNRYIAALRGELIKMDLYDVVYALFNALVLYGKCPSLLDNNKYDREVSDYMPIKDTFQQVDLISHSFRVLDLGLKLVEQQPVLHSATTEVVMIIMALAFDISKIYGAQGRFAKIDHPKSSSSILRVLMEPKGMDWDFLYDDILLHHESPQSNFGEILKQADGMAREQEMAILKGTRSYLNMEAWFDLTWYKEIIRQGINEYHDGKLGAFTLGSTLFVTPNFLFDAVKKLADERHVFDIALFRSSDRRSVLIKIAQFFKQGGYIAGDLPYGSFGRYYEIMYSTKKRPNERVHLLPLKIDYFGMPCELEKKKKGDMRWIERVTASRNYRSKKEG